MVFIVEGNMTEEQWKQVDTLRCKIGVKIHDMVDKELEGVDPQVGEEVRAILTENFRFWERQK